MTTSALKITIGENPLGLTGGPYAGSQEQADKFISGAKEAIKRLVDLGFAPQDALYTEFSSKWEPAEAGPR